MYGMFLKHLTDEIIVEILKIYERVTGGRAFVRIGERAYPYLKCEQILEELKGSGSIERRFGSKLTMHSKLYIFEKYFVGDRVICFDFYPNLGHCVRDEHKKKAEEMTEAFEKEIHDFLVRKKFKVFMD